MLENVIPRLLARVPTSVRSVIIGRPDHPSRVSTLAHNLLNRVTPPESQGFACQGPLEGYRMYIDWTRFRSFVYGTWEPKVTKAVTEAVEPGMTVIDVGAHIGYYTLLFAKCVGPTGSVFSFEPVPRNFALLEKNVQVNNLRNVRLVNEAVFSRAASITINVPEEQPNPGSGSMKCQEGAEHYEVDATSLDDFCEESGVRPDILKIDVEGAEYDVLVGAQQTISRCRPGLFIELHHFDGNVAAHPVPGWLANCGYQVHWIEQWQLASYIFATMRERVGGQEIS